jgi:hypothetical protein
MAQYRRLGKVCIDCLGFALVKRPAGGDIMKIVVIGGTGLIGSKTVAILRHGGHEVLAAAI